MTAPQPPDWSAYSHEFIYHMVTQGDYQLAAQAAEDNWVTTRVAIRVIEDKLQKGLRDIGSGWEGQSAEAVARGISPLGEWALQADERGQATADAIQRQNDYAFHTLRNMPVPQYEGMARTMPDGLPAADAVRWARENQQRLDDEQRARDLMAAYQANSESSMPAMASWVAPPRVVFAGDGGAGSGSGDGAVPSGAATGIGAADVAGGPGAGGAGGTATGGAGPGPTAPGAGVGPGGAGAPTTGSAAGAGAPVPGPGAGAVRPGVGYAGSGTPGMAGRGGVTSQAAGAPGRAAPTGGADLRTGAGGTGPTGSGRPSGSAGVPGGMGPATGSAPRLFASPAPGSSTGPGPAAPTNWRDVVRANGGFRADPVAGTGANPGGTGAGSGGGRPPTVEQTPRGAGAPTASGGTPARPGHPAVGHPGMMPMTGGGTGATGETRRRARYLLDDQGIFDVEHLLHYNPPVILPPDHPDYR